MGVLSRPAVLWPANIGDFDDRTRPVTRPVASCGGEKGESLHNPKHQTPTPKQIPFSQAAKVKKTACGISGEMLPVGPAQFPARLSAASAHWRPGGLGSLARAKERAWGCGEAVWIGSGSGVGVCSTRSVRGITASATSIARPVKARLGWAVFLCYRPPLSKRRVTARAA